MRFQVLRAVAPLLGALCLPGCSTTVVAVDPVGAAQPALPEDCEVAIYKKASPPPGPYKTLGKIESHISRNMFAGGAPQVEAETRRELREKACQLGANAVVIDDAIESSASEMRHMHVWARAIRLPAPAAPATGESRPAN